MKDLNYYLGLNYRVEFLEDKDEGGFVFCCPELAGCITCAATLEDGYKRIQDAKLEWLAAALESGFEIPVPIGIDAYSGQFKLRLPKSLHRSLAEQSRLEGVSMNQYCVYLLSRGEHPPHSA